MCRGVVAPVQGYGKRGPGGHRQTSSDGGPYFYFWRFLFVKINSFADAPFQGVNETQRRTGLSKAALYRGANDGSYPCIRQGKRILFNIPKLMEVLNKQSARDGEGN